MRVYIVVLCLALISENCWAQAPGAPQTATATATADGGAAAAAVGDAGASATASGGASGASPLPTASGMPSMAPNQMMGQMFVTGSQFGQVGADAGFKIADDSIGVVNTLGGMIPIFGSPMAAMITQPARAGTDLGQSITRTSLDLARRYGEMMINDQTGAVNALFAAKMNHRLNRLAPPPTALAFASGGLDPTMLLAAGAGGLNPTVMTQMSPVPMDPSMLGGMLPIGDPSALSGIPPAADPSMMTPGPDVAVAAAGTASATAVAA